MKTDMAKVIRAISKNMPCWDCPYPCNVGLNSSTANCQKHWYGILTGIEKCSWEETSQTLLDMYAKDCTEGCF